MKNAPAPAPDGATAPAAVSASKRNKDNERPLAEDIRLLGRILGDVIREQEGQDAFDLIEQIRKLSVAFRRDADHAADRAAVHAATPKAILAPCPRRPHDHLSPLL